MYKVIVTHKNGTVETYKSKHICDDVKMINLPYSLKLKNGLKNVDRNKLVHEHYRATIDHQRIDGRSKEASKLKYFTVRCFL